MRRKLAEALSPLKLVPDRKFSWVRSLMSLNDTLGVIGGRSRRSMRPVDNAESSVAALLPVVDMRLGGLGHCCPVGPGPTFCTASLISIWGLSIATDSWQMLQRGSVQAALGLHYAGAGSQLADGACGRDQRSEGYKKTCARCFAGSFVARVGHHI